MAYVTILDMLSIDINACSNGKMYYIAIQVSKPEKIVAKNEQLSKKRSLLLSPSYHFGITKHSYDVNRSL